MSFLQRIRTPFSELAEADSFEEDRYARAVGDLLRERREEYRLDLETVGAALCIKPVYLAALEQGRSQDLPGPAYAIGFVRAYANYLGFDGERLLDSYKAEAAVDSIRPDLSLPVPLGERSVPGGPILLVAGILALCGYGTWYYLSTGERSRPERVATVPTELQQEAAQPIERPSPATAGAPANAPIGSKLATGLDPQNKSLPPANPTTDSAPAGNAVPAIATAATDAAPAAAPAPASAPAPAAVGIDIRALADCWIQVRAADDSIVFSRVLKSGETYRVPRPGLVLRTGNAGALAILVDGKPAPSIGGIGTLRRSVALDATALLGGTAVRG